MPTTSGLDVWQLLLSGSALTVLVAFTILAMQGRVRYEKGVLEQYALYEKRIVDLQKQCDDMARNHEQEITRLEARNDRLWESLQQTLVAAREAYAATKHATQVTERATQVTETAVKGGS